jgi:hypothetical protein
MLLALAAISACAAPAPGPETASPTGAATGTPGTATESGPAPIPPTATLTPIPLASPTPYAGSIDQPFPLGAEAEWSPGEGPVLRIEITEAYRGWAARQAVLAHGEPEAAAPEGFEWFYFRAEVAYTGSGQGPMTLDADFWRAVSAGTTTTWADAPVCCLTPGFDFTLAAGETRTGVLALLVPVDDLSPLIVAGAGPDGAGGIHFAASADTLTPTNVLFEDDFSSNEGGWQDVFRDKTGISDYDQGGFRILVAEPNFDYWANPGLDFADARLEVETTMIGGPEDNVFGLVCRYADPENFYVFLISSDGFYAIAKYTGGEYALIGADLMLESEAIRTGTATNRLRADCVGETLWLFVIGEQLAEATDSDHSTGDVGLIAGTFDVAGTDIIFDYFAILAP